MFHVTKRGYFSSGNLGGMGFLEVSSQNSVSKAWKQCSGMQTWGSSSGTASGAGLGGIRDIEESAQVNGLRVRGWEQEARGDRMYRTRRKPVQIRVSDVRT